MNNPSHRKQDYFMIFFFSSFLLSYIRDLAVVCDTKCRWLPGSVFGKLMRFSRYPAIPSR